MAQAGLRSKESHNMEVSRSNSSNMQLPPINPIKGLQDDWGVFVADGKPRQVFQERNIDLKLHW